MTIKTILEKAIRMAGLSALFLTLVAGSTQGDLVAAEAFVMGGFDASRGGEYSLQDGSALIRLREAISSSYPGVSLTGNSVLTDEYLSSINVLLVTAAFDGFTGITPLAQSEQDALISFIIAGGRALIYTDNEIQFGPASDSLLAPFGVTRTGVLEGEQAATVLGPSAHPVTNGPFGEILTYRTFWPGWYTDLGPYAIPLAILDTNSEITLAVIDPGVISAASGAVVFSSDINIFNEFAEGANLNLVLNAIAFLTQ
jgi:hypothetical protein